MRVSGGERRFAVARDRHEVALGLEAVAEREDEALLVLDEQDAPLQLRHAAQPRRAVAAARAGSAA